MKIITGKIKSAQKGVAFNSVRIEKLEEELSRIRKEFIIAKKEVG